MTDETPFAGRSVAPGEKGRTEAELGKLRAVGELDERLELGVCRCVSGARRSDAQVKPTGAPELSFCQVWPIASNWPRMSVALDRSMRPAFLPAERTWLAVGGESPFPF